MNAGLQRPLRPELVSQCVSRSPAQPRLGRDASQQRLGLLQKLLLHWHEGGRTPSRAICSIC